jgi:hypothetical protein
MFHVHLNFNFWQLFLEKCAKKIPKTCQNCIFSVSEGQKSVTGL